MLAAVVAAVLVAQPVALERDAYGVARVTAPSFSQALHGFGKAVAEDRLWQMEMSRRSARGRLAEVLGPSAVASDRETLLLAYTDDELQAQLDALDERTREAFTAYAAGVNETIAARTEAGTLPPGYAANGFAPEPWTPLDSAAIAVSLARRFGAGGAGELRILAVREYLKLRPVREQALDVLDDLAWQNDPSALTTVPADLDPLAQTHPRFPDPDRATTEAHLAQLPPTNILELAPAIALSEQRESAELNALLGVPYKTGSYAVVVDAANSVSGKPLLLSAPQMGHGQPSIAYDIALNAPGYQVAGLAVPGVPAVIIGYSPTASWGMTTGVIDLEDIFVARLASDDAYTYGDETRPIQRITFTRPVKGAEPVEVVQERTHHGPVVLRSRAGNAVYSRQSAFWQTELEGFQMLYSIPGATTAEQVRDDLREATVGFNVFYALTSGEVGYQLVGHFPIRAEGLDPRFPTPSAPENEWQGTLDLDQMPHLHGREVGVLSNWNNKPATWWNNGDTPVWGRLWRVGLLRDALPARPLSRHDLEFAAWTIARGDEPSLGAFLPRLQAVLGATRFEPGPEADAATLLSRTEQLMAVEGDVAITVYRAFVANLRRELFLSPLGNFTDDSLFETVVQPTLLWNALEGTTRVDWLAGRTADEVVASAYRKAIAELVAERGPNVAAWGYGGSWIRYGDAPRVAYSARGTYIQITEMSQPPVARSVAGPGVSEDHPVHAFDQISLVRQWTYKPMWGW